MTIAYDIGDSLYVNVTNRCTNKCSFCIRHTPSGVGDVDLWLEREPTADEIYKAIIDKNINNYKELVFCGYGEPTYRINEIIYCAKKIKEISDIPIRINTNGHTNKICGKDVTPLFEGCIDIVSISLNASTAEKYNKICGCEFGRDGFFEMLDFAKKVKKYVPRTILTVVDIIGKEEIEACRNICREMGCEYRIRKYSE